MVSTIEALVPVFLVIIAGRLFGHLAFPSEDFWDKAASLAYWVLLPALLFRATSDSKLAGTNYIAIGLIVTLPILLTISLCIVFGRFTGRRMVADPAFLQSCIRQNSYVALAASYALWGQSALATVAVILAIYVPFTNTLCAWLLTRAHKANGNAALAWQKQLMAIVANPLVLACLAGILLAYTDFELPEVIGASIDIFAGAALPLALLAVGASLRFDVFRHEMTWLILASVIKLITFPMTTWIVAIALGVSHLELAVLVLVAAMPMAASAYPLTKELGGDARFVASAISLQTLLAMLTLPIFAMALGAYSISPH